MPLFDAIHANLIGKFDGSLQAAERRNVRAADTLKAFGADLCVIPAFRGDGVPQTVDYIVADVQESAALGRLQPFVRTGGIHVATEFVNIEFHHARDMRAIDGRENAFGTSKRGKFFHR